jgi:PKD repeat protein
VKEFTALLLNTIKEKSNGVKNMDSKSKMLATFLMLMVLPMSAFATSCNGGSTNYGNSTNCTISGFTADITNGTAPLTVTFAGDVTGRPKITTWIFGTEHITPDSAVGALKYKYTFKEPGVYGVTLKVRGRDGNIAELKKDGYITVNKKVVTPTNTGKVVTTSNCKKTFNFKYSGNTCGVKSVKWNFGDGKTGNGYKVSHTYSKKGSYKVTTYVNFRNGHVSKYSNCVTVK